MSWQLDWLALLQHVDEHLVWLVQTYGEWSYAVLFVIVFCETGLVVTPFLPGDSLLFAGGALAAVGSLDFVSLVTLLMLAAIAGDATNYAVGRSLTERWARRSRYVRREHLERAEAFYRAHGGKAIVLARFAPFLRTFVPFVAGAAQMPYGRFAFFNVIGGIGWVMLCCAAGYFFGHIPFVEQNFAGVMLGIIVLSLLPVVVSAGRARLARPGVLR